MSDEPQPYDDDMIQVLRGLEVVRRRPSMYVGRTDVTAVHNMICALVEYALDQEIVGACNQVTIDLLPNGVIKIQDNSRGFPTDPDARSGHPKLELLLTDMPTLFTVYHRPVTGSWYRISLAAVNALSEWLTITVQRDGYLWEQTFDRGVARAPMTQTPARDSETTGNTLTFKPDLEIFSSDNVEFLWLEENLKPVAYLTPELSITLHDHRCTPSHEATYHSDIGLQAMVHELRPESVTPLHDPVHLQETVTIKRGQDRRTPYTVNLAFALQFTESVDPAIEVGFIQKEARPAVGTHMAAVKRGIVQVLNRHSRQSMPFRWQDISEGTVLAVAIDHPGFGISYDYLGRPALREPEIFNPVRQAVARTFSAFANTHPDQMQRIIDHCLANRRR